MYTLMQIYPQPESPTHLAHLLEAVAEPTRLRILNLLEQGEFCVCELQAVLGLNEPTVSRHLTRLRFSGLVSSCRNGSRVVYRLLEPDSPIKTILHRFLREVSCEEPALQRDRKTAGDLARSRKRA